MTEIKNSQAKTLKDEFERHKNWLKNALERQKKLGKARKLNDVGQLVDEFGNLVNDGDDEIQEGIIATLQKEIAEHDATLALRCCRLRYRSKTPFGGLHIWDRIFVIQDDGRVRECTEKERTAAERYFPE